MRIAFGDFSGWDYNVQSAGTKPLGGSQSAACYLAQALAANHEVFLITQTTAPGRYGNVTCLSWRETPEASLKSMRLDVFVCLPGAGNGPQLRKALGVETRLVLWTQHRIDQPVVQSLAEPAESGCYDGFVFVSEWQREEFRLGFGLPPARMHVLGNGVAPAFADLFPEDQPILPSKASPPLLAYTSTPFRGLNMLVEAFPAIRTQIPEVRLRVFSSMAVYQETPADDVARYGALYERCRQTPGIEYVGSLPQPALAREMRAVSVLAYPNTFPETFCIAALEAMASGCRVVTSAQGALPETTGGFAELIPVGRDRSPDIGAFVERTVHALREMQSGDPAVEETLQRQVRYVRENATWRVRARQWENWLRATWAAS